MIQASRAAAVAPDRWEEAAGAVAALARSVEEAAAVAATAAVGVAAEPDSRGEVTKSRALALARDVLAPRLARRGWSVAITGSVARGDAGPGSDLDLWVIGPRSGRRSLVERGVPVTLLMQTPAEARSFDSLCLFEVGDLIVVSDPSGHFEKVKRAFAKRRAAIRRAIVEATLEDLRFELDQGALGSTWSRVMFLRAAGFRLCALWLFKQTGWRVPRIRTLRSHLPPGARSALLRLLALPELTPRLVRSLPATIARVDRWLKDAARRGALSRRVFADLPREVLSKWRAGETEDAAWLLRKQLTQEWLPPLLDARGANDVANLALADAPRGLRALFLEAHGLKGVSAWDRKKTAQVTAQLRALAGQLGLSRLVR